MKVLTPAQKEQFESEGFLVIEDLLDPVEDLQPVFDEYAQVLDGVVREFLRGGIIKSGYEGLPFNERLVAVCAESGRNFPQYFDFSLPQKDIREDTPIHVGPAIFRTLTHPRLLDVVEDMIGPEIFSNPVQHLRMKLPPRVMGKGPHSYLTGLVPWHQDNGVILAEADKAEILTVWMPLTPSTIENGCLQVVPRSHRHGLDHHCPTKIGIAIPERLVAASAAVPLPMRPGSALLLTQRTVHSSLENTTADEVRLSLDLRYQPTGQPTGRPAFTPAGFVARSAAHPESVLRDPAAWAARWREVRAQLAHVNPTFNRWSPGDAACA